MCHEILKEEDDEVASLDDVSSDKKHLDELLDEQNGNLTAKLTNLTLDESTENADQSGDDIDGINGNSTTNTNASNNDRLNSANAKANKKKSKKGTNSITVATADIECDSNDNKLDVVDENNDEDSGMNRHSPSNNDAVNVLA